MKVKHAKQSPPSKPLTKKQLKSLVGGAEEQEVPDSTDPIDKTGIGDELLPNKGIDDD